MTHIEERIIEKANDVVNHFLALGAIVSKADYDFVVGKLTDVKDELIIEFKTN